MRYNKAHTHHAFEALVFLLSESRLGSYNVVLTLTTGIYCKVNYQPG